MKALLVEDNPGDIRFLQELLLKRATLTPITLDLSQTLTKAHELLSANTYDVILLDLSLPDAQGIETILSIRQAYPHLPIIVLTGLDDEVIATHAMREGAQDFLVKGAFDANLVIRTMRHAVERKKLEQKLRTALDRAEAANYAKTNFLASMSHELRTPLNAIIGFSELLQHQLYGPIGDSRYNDYINDIYKSGQYLLSLINDLLDLSKATVGKLELQEEWTDLPELLKECINLMRLQLTKKHLEVSFDLHDACPGLWADPRFLKRILFNLLSNAVKFTPAYGKIIVGTFTDPMRQSLGFFVQDTGIGIAHQDIDRALEPFVQIHHPHHTTTQQGTGLGLPLSKHMVELHGGSLIMTSDLGKGTQAMAHFPRWRATRPDS